MHTKLHTHIFGEIDQNVSRRKLPEAKKKNNINCNYYNSKLISTGNVLLLTDTYLIKLDLSVSQNCSLFLILIT